MNRNHDMASVFFAMLMGALTSVWADTHYVNVDNPLPSSPYTNWMDAATTIQAAIDVAEDGDVVLVTNGMYNTGGVAVYGNPTNDVAVTNRVAITNVIAVQSVNGPEYTTIIGYKGGSEYEDGIRCACVKSGAKLIGFTLTGGSAAPCLRCHRPFTSEDCCGGIVFWSDTLNTNHIPTVENCVMARKTETR